jgi:hypothetical protein
MADIQTLDNISEELGRRSRAVLAERRANREIMIFVEVGWVFRESPGQVVERICELEDFRAANYPLTK